MTAIIIINNILLLLLIIIMCLNPIHNEFFDLIFKFFPANFLLSPDNRELVHWCRYSW